MQEEEKKEKGSWFSRLRSGLQRSATKLADNIGAVFTKRKLDAGVLEELEEILIGADLGPQTASKLVQSFGASRFGKEVTDLEVREALADQIAALLKPLAVPLSPDAAKKPYVVLFVGVNGTGKTTTIGKLAHYYKAKGLKVTLVACDTFRAAAVEQLRVWASRAGCPLVSGVAEADAAGLAYTALQQAQKDGTDLLLIDTAGRLHNKEGLMQELAKVVRVLKKLDPSVPHATLLVLDATTGQNAFAQVETFRDLTQVTGLIVTKLDGSAKGGVLVGLADRFQLPIHAIGVGESAADLQPFRAEDFARSLFSLEEKQE